MLKRVGLLGGSFNPAHGGHRQISLAAARALNLDEVWWLVSPGNPLKPREGMAPLAARLGSAIAMARRARASPRSSQPGQHKPVGPFGAADFLAHRIGQVGHAVDRGGDCFQPAGIEPQPVEQRGGQARRLARGNVARIGGKDRRLVRAQRRRRGMERRRLGRRIHPRQHGLRGAAIAGEPRDQINGAFGGVGGLVGHAARLPPAAALVTAGNHPAHRNPS